MKKMWNKIKEIWWDFWEVDVNDKAEERLRNCRKIKSPFILTNYNISITMYLSHSGG